MRKWIATSLSVAVLLSITTIPVTARDGNNREAYKSVRFDSAEVAGPIGRISSGGFLKNSVTINNRPAADGQNVWSGDLVESSNTSRVSVALDSIGEITLSKRSTVRLTATPGNSEEGRHHPVLTAALSEGEIAVRLESSSHAYVTRRGVSYVSSPGANFVARANETAVAFDVKSGRILRDAQGTQHQYVIRPVGHGDKIKVPAGGLARLQVQVLEDNTPVPGVAVLFVLDTSSTVIGLLGMGTLSGTTANVVTDADGTAAVQFVARNMEGSSPVSATIEGTRVSWTGQITVTGKAGVSRGKGWAIAAILGAGAAAGIAYALTRDKTNLEAQPPVVKNP